MRTSRQQLRTSPDPLPSVVRASVADCEADGTIVVDVAGERERIRCDFLENGPNASLVLVPGDPVLVLRPARPGERGCVLGRVGAYRPSTGPGAERHLVIEAGDLLTLRCGESSVDLRKDGKLMIRGVDVLTRAKRVNRIKGGSVAIN